MNMKEESMAKNTSKTEKKGALSIKNVTKIYDPTGVNVMAVDNCSMEIAAGEVCMIVGPSGCGKTTLLNAIAGFHSITEGSIHLDGELLCGPERPKAEQSAERMVVFQHGALFPWKTLQENVAYGPTVQKALSPSQAMEKSGQMLAEAGLGNFVKKFPGEVSSGMARRAEIVRALINNPKVLLLDEPTEGIQPSIIKQLAQDLKRIRDERGLSILVSEQVLSFVMDSSDRIMVIENGRIVHENSREDVDQDTIIKYLAV